MAGETYKSVATEDQVAALEAATAAALAGKQPTIAPGTYAQVETPGTPATAVDKTSAQTIAGAKDFLTPPTVGGLALSAGVLTTAERLTGYWYAGETFATTAATLQAAITAAALLATPTARRAVIVTQGFDSTSFGVITGADYVDVIGATGNPADIVITSSANAHTVGLSGKNTMWAYVTVNHTGALGNYPIHADGVAANVEYVLLGVVANNDSQGAVGVGLRSTGGAQKFWAIDCDLLATGANLTATQQTALFVHNANDAIGTPAVVVVVVNTRARATHASTGGVTAYGFLYRNQGNVAVNDQVYWSGGFAFGTTKDMAFYGSSTTPETAALGGHYQIDSSAYTQVDQPAGGWESVRAVTPPAPSRGWPNRRIAQLPVALDASAAGPGPFIPVTDKGAANGVAGLDASGFLAAASVRPGNVQTFTAAGAQTVTVPPGATRVAVHAVGGGGGGGGGAQEATGTAAWGGGPGGPGGYTFMAFDIASLVAAFGAGAWSINPGAGGASGAGGPTNGSNGSSGGNAGSTIFKIGTTTVLQTPVATGGSGGTTSNGNAGSAGGGTMPVATTPTNVVTGTPSTPGVNAASPGWGGCGGGLDASNNRRDGGAGGKGGLLEDPSQANAAGGVGDGVGGAAGVIVASTSLMPGPGGAGGAASLIAAGGAGGAGVRGGGGGGGGGSRNGFAGGAGGAGGTGYARFEFS